MSIDSLKREQSYRDIAIEKISLSVDERRRKGTLLHQLSSSIKSPNLEGNLGTLTTLDNTLGQLVTVAEARTVDGKIIPITVTLVDADQIGAANPATKAAVVTWGAGGVNNISGLLEFGQGRSFSVHASAVRVDVVSVAVAGTSEIGAYLTEGETIHQAIAFATPGVIAAGANVVALLQPFANEVMFVPQFDGQFLAEFRRSDTAVINSILIPVNGITPWIPVQSNLSDVLITNQGAAQKIIYMYQRLQM
jgi:hypothetical protein